MPDHNPPRSWIVEFWSQIFYYLSFLSVFQSVRTIFLSERLGYRFVEYYVFLNTLASVVVLAVVTYRRDERVTTLFVIVVLYAGLRVFEISIYQINVLLFDEYRAKRAGIEYKVKGYRRIVLLLLHNYVELVCWFGTLYMYFYRSGDLKFSDEAVLPTFSRVFRESFLMMTSFQPDAYRATSGIGLTVLSVQSVLGLLMTLLMLARFVALLPPPDTMDEDEREP